MNVLSIWCDYTLFFYDVHMIQKSLHLFLDANVVHARPYQGSASSKNNESITHNLFPLHFHQKYEVPFVTSPLIYTTPF